MNCLPKSCRDCTAALQSDLDRLNNELRGRSWVHSQSESQHRMLVRKMTKNTVM